MLTKPTAVIISQYMCQTIMLYILNEYVICKKNIRGNIHDIPGIWNVSVVAQVFTDNGIKSIC